MPPKQPVRGKITVDIHARPDEPDLAAAQRRDASTRTHAGPDDALSPTVTLRHGMPLDEAGLDAITPAPVLTIKPTETAAARPTTESMPLAHYWISADITLAPANEHGVRIHKGRQYVDVAEGGIVEVAPIAATGQLRARLPSELHPSGPVLVRDPTSHLWEPLEVAPITFALSAARLQGFRTALDFTGITPGDDGLFRLDGKLYVVIDNHAYQTLHDLDASTALTPVMRIVRIEDPVAGATDNRYVATRPGRSQAIVFDPVDGWVGVNVPGAGGMQREQGSQPSSWKDHFSSALNRLKSPAARVRKLYPALTEAQVTVLVRSFGTEAAALLTRQEADYRTLKNELAAWSRDNTATSTQGSGPEWMASVANDIKRCWRQETAALKIVFADEHPALPRLTVDLANVRTLELDSLTWSDAADAFLNRFSDLSRLVVNRSTLDKLPVANTAMRNLITLDLGGNQIRLDQRSAARLARLQRLRHIDLSGNPLGRTPDFAAMDQLQTLNLSNTGIEQWPTGLHRQSGLTLVDLRHNQLSEVPEAVLNPPADQLPASARINGVTRLEGNRFAADCWKSLEAFWERVGADHPDLVSRAHPAAFRLDADIPEVGLIRRLHPDKDAQTARVYLMGLDEATRNGLAGRVEALEHIDVQLKEYVENASTAHPRFKLWRQEVVETLRQCWLDKSADTLTLPKGLGPLPALQADFSHVRTLVLRTVDWSDAGDLFLRSFNSLESLSITHCGLKFLPDSVGEMSKLTQLDLSSNSLVLDEQAAARISGLSRLTTLDLSANPLDVIPDFSAMTQLEYLLLSDTGLNRWPSGLHDKTALKRLDLRNNRLNEVPAQFLDPAPEQLLTIARINTVTALDGSDFPSNYWRRFDDYWRRVNEVDPELLTSGPDDIIFDSENSQAQRYRRLYPRKNIKQCREYLWSLEEDAASARLTGLEQDFSGLKRQLDDWVYSGAGNLMGYIPANQLAANANSRRDRLKASERIISCWRQETPQKLAFDRTPIGLELDLSGLRLPSLPDIDVDFSHVGSLKLNNMDLRASPEGFLTRFRHVRWLYLSRNQLRELPPAIGEMHGLTRLSLDNNQLSLTAETARVLSERTTLRALNLQDNPRLGICPDFSRITDMRHLDLANTGIDTFPAGIAEQPLLDTFNLSNNRIVDIPDAVIAPTNERLPHTVRINNVTNVRNNLLSDATLARINQYNERLLQAETPLSGPNNLVDTARGHVPAAIHTTAADPMARWTKGMAADAVQARRIQWQALEAQQGSGGLFDTLERLLLPESAGRADLQQRVWKLIDSISENSERSENLRREVFDRAGEATCCDRAAFTFANLETRVMMHHALAQAGDREQGPALFQLSRALFRLHEIDTLAAADIAQREAAIAESRTPEEARRLPAPQIPEEVEIRLFYRHALRDRLLLPGQPERMGFGRLVNVSDEQVNAAHQSVLALDNSVQEFQALVAREFWQKFITNKYQVDFETQRQPFQDRQAALDDLHAANELAPDDYQTQSNSLQASWIVAESALIETLTRQELAGYPTGSAVEEAAGTTV